MRKGAHVSAVLSVHERDSLKSRESFLTSFPHPKRGGLNVWAGYPAPYRVAMSNLGFHFLFAALLRSGRMRVERFFLDTSPYTLESAIELSRADVLMVSVSYEEDCINLARMLVGAGIEPLRERRKGKPVLIAGGPAVSANPLPVSVLADLVVLGEGEIPLDGILSILSDGPGPRELIDECSRLQGVYRPGGHSAAFAEKREEPDFCSSVIVTPATVFADTRLIETGRGCPGACSFCLARSLYGSYRSLPVDRFEARITESGPGVRKIGLVSTAVAAHPRFSEMLDLVASRGLGIGFSSLRAEDIDDEKAALIGGSGVRSVSLAPESGSERIRRLLGKMAGDGRFFRAARALAALRREVQELVGGLVHEDARPVSLRQDVERERAGLEVAATPVARLGVRGLAGVELHGHALGHVEQPQLAREESVQRPVDPLEIEGRAKGTVERHVRLEDVVGGLQRPAILPRPVQIEQLVGRAPPAAMPELPAVRDGLVAQLRVGVLVGGLQAQHPEEQQSGLVLQASLPRRRGPRNMYASPVL